MIAIHPSPSIVQGLEPSPGYTLDRSSIQYVAGLTDRDREPFKAMASSESPINPIFGYWEETGAPGVMQMGENELHTQKKRPQLAVGFKPRTSMLRCGGVNPHAAFLL